PASSPSLLYMPSSGWWLPPGRQPNGRFWPTASPRRSGGRRWGRLSAFRGLIGFPAPYIGGLLYDRFGFKAPIMANLVGVAIALVTVAIAVKEPVRE
ncbi:MAG: hypothetical protein U9Q76_05590, partial [candidate division WOR-3 bacterium]|nr:hypothetical protein [candidate division WOR-3 bacterium]